MSYRGREGKEREGGAENYHQGRLLDGVAAQGVARHFDARADHHAGKVPGAVLEDGQEEDPDEEDAVKHRGEDREGKGRRVHPHNVVVVGHGKRFEN